MQQHPLSPLSTDLLQPPTTSDNTSTSPHSSHSSDSSSVFCRSPHLNQEGHWPEVSHWQGNGADDSMGSDGFPATYKPPDPIAPNDVYLPPNKISLPAAFRTGTYLSPMRPSSSDPQLNTHRYQNPTNSFPNSNGEVTPRAELGIPTWPSDGQPTPRTDRAITSALADGDIEMASTASRSPPTSFPLATGRKKYTSLDLESVPSLSEPLSLDAALAADLRRTSEPIISPTSQQQRVVADSSDTGCRILAPISPPAHYPGSSGPDSRRRSSSRPLSADMDQVSSSSSSGSGRPPLHKHDSYDPTAPRWAQPPLQTNKISGRAWSFSQGQERPDIDFDPELFDGSNPEAVEEIMKGTDGRIAVKTTQDQHVILVWLPGISISDITISTKGDRTVQIVADRWDENDHLEWNVLLGRDANMKAIAAKLQNSELRVTIQRKTISTHNSVRSNYSSWSAPARVAQATNAQPPKNNSDHQLRTMTTSPAPI